MRPPVLAALAALLCAGCVTAPPSLRDQVGSSLRSQIIQCWSPPAEPVSTSYRPKFKILLKANGALDGAPLLLNPSADPVDAALAASAAAALKSCSPFKIPPTLVDHPGWKEVNITFDPHPR